MTSSTFSIGISHIGLAVNDLDASLAFFEALGYKKVGGDPSYPVYKISNDRTILTLWKTDEDYSSFNRKKNVGLHHLALQLETESQLLDAYEAVLKVPGTKSEFGLQSFGLGKHVMVIDPSGLRIELAIHV